MTLEDLPGRCLSTLAQCAGLRALTLRRCGLKCLDAIKQLKQLCYVDVQVDVFNLGLSVWQFVVTVF